MSSSGLSGGSMTPPAQYSTPYALNSPLGSVSYSGQTANYTSPLSTQNTNLINQANNLTSSYLSQLPTSTNINAAFNNPMYSTTAQLYEQPINEAYQQATTNLNNSLNAANQQGSSYGALQNYYNNQNYQNQLTTADNNARLAAYNAYTGQNNYALNALQTLGGVGNTALSQEYTPYSYMLQNQQVIDPLQTGAMNYGANTYGTNAQLFGTAANVLTSY